MEIGRSDITLDPNSHHYFNAKGEWYMSVSHVLNRLAIPFNSQRIASFMARKKWPGADAKELVIRQKEIVQEWIDKRDEAADYGKDVHDALDEYSRIGKCEPKYLEMARTVHRLWSHCRRQYSEQMLYSDKFGIAGTADKIIQRTTGQNPIFDIYDYKTNVNGISFSSSKEKDGIIKHYGKFYVYPFDHIEDCGYNRYALQLSAYAFMLKSTYESIRIGRLGIIWISPELKTVLLPVPYMEETIIQIFMWFSLLKSLQ